jgi:hypothetical protein
MDVDALTYLAAHAPPVPDWFPLPVSPVPPEPAELVRLHADSDAHDAEFCVCPPDADLTDWHARLSASATRLNERYAALGPLRQQWQDAVRAALNAREFAREVEWRWHYAMLMLCAKPPADAGRSIGTSP